MNGANRPGNGVAVVLEDLHEAEVDLHLELQRVSERHCADAEVAGALRGLSRWSERHVEMLAAEGRRFGLDLGSTPRSTNRVAAGLRRKSSELIASRSTAAVMLVNDLRQLFGDASLVQLDWELLAELAKATHDRELLALSERSSNETQRLLTWVESKLKESVVHLMTMP
jgi:hypothetical protein